MFSGLMGLNVAPSSTVLSRFRSVTWSQPLLTPPMRLTVSLNAQVERVVLRVEHTGRNPGPALDVPVRAHVPHVEVPAHADARGVEHLSERGARAAWASAPEGAANAAETADAMRSFFIERPFVGG